MAKVVPDTMIIDLRSKVEDIYGEGLPHTIREPHSELLLSNVRPNSNIIFPTYT